VGGLLQRLHSLLSISAVLSLALSLLTVTLIYTYVPGGKRPAMQDDASVVSYTWFAGSQPNICVSSLCDEGIAP